MKFEIRNRFTGDIQFTAEIKCNEGAKTSIKIGLAVKWAIKTRANLAGAYLARADLADVSKIEESNIPVIPQIDAVILAAIEAGGTLDMSTWHGDGGWCGTTHCRAGWAVHCAGQPGRDLEEKVGTQIAAAMIYRASRPGQAAPWFYASDEKTMADIRKCAAEQIGESKRSEEHTSELQSRFD